MPYTSIREEPNEVPQEYLVEVSPVDFIPPLITAASYLESLKDQGFNIDYFLKSMWRMVIITEIFKLKFGTSKRSLWKKYISPTSETSQRAYEFLEKHEAFDNSVSLQDRAIDFLKSLEGSINYGDIKLTLKKGSLTEIQRSDIEDKLRKFSFSEINHLLKDFDKIIDGSSYYLIIDNLDLSSYGINFSESILKSLIIAIKDFAKLKNVKPIVSLRTNIFHQMNFDQPDKLKIFISKISWDDNQLKKMISKRFEFIFNVDTNFVWQNILPKNINLGENKQISIHKYLIRMSNRKPRDLFQLIAIAMKYSIGKNRITQEAFKKAEDEYCNERLRNLIDEWKSPFPQLSKILECFKGKPSTMNTAQLRSTLEDVVCYAIDNPNLEGNESLVAHGFISTDEDKFSETDGLLNFLFKLGVIGIKNQSNHKIRFCFDYGFEPSNLKIDDSVEFVINPSIASELTGNFSFIAPEFDFEH